IRRSTAHDLRSSASRLLIARSRARRILQQEVRHPSIGSLPSLVTVILRPRRRCHVTVSKQRRRRRSMRDDLCPNPLCLNNVIGPQCRLNSVGAFSSGGDLMHKRSVLAALAACLGASTAMQSASAASLNEFNHIVVIYQENHSFDNLYGLWGEVGDD